MLSCEQLRQIKLTDPKRVTVGIRLHRLLCPKCACFLDKADALDRDVEDALRIDVPESLVERILCSCDPASASAATTESPRLRSRVLAALSRIFGSRHS